MCNLKFPQCQPIYLKHGKLGFFFTQTYLEFDSIALKTRNGTISNYRVTSYLTNDKKYLWNQTAFLSFLLQPGFLSCNWFGYESWIKLIRWRHLYPRAYWVMQWGSRTVAFRIIKHHILRTKRSKTLSSQWPSIQIFRWKIWMSQILYYYFKT